MKNKRQDCIAGIVTYNQNIDRLSENIKAVIKQINEVVIFDNGSDNIEDINKKFTNYNNVKILSSSQNMGIAYALNKISEYAINNNYKWLLTLDGDSIIYPKLIDNYQKYMDLPYVGQLSCELQDRNINSKVNINDYKVEKVKYCITSGSLIKLDALKKVGGFNNKLFIDWVDNEICCALRKKGYQIYRINYIGLLQEMGHATQAKILGKKINLYRPNYNFIRYYYNARNSIYVSRLYPNEEKVSKIVANQFKVVILILLFETNKIKKTRAIFKGISEGLKWKKSRKRYL